MWIPDCKAPTQFPDVGIPILHWYRSSNIQTHLHRENPRQSEMLDKHQKRGEFQPDHGRKEKMMENTCKTCINNDDGLCDRKGILVEDEDFCEYHWAAGKKIRMKRHEKKMDITPELMLSAYNTLIQGCKSRPASEDGTCSNCILYQHCPGTSNLLPEDWQEIHYPFLTGNTLHYIKAGKVKQIVFARREDAEERLSEMEEKRG